MKITEINKRISIGQRRPIENSSTNKVVTFIKKNCTEILNVYKFKRYLYSGIENMPSIFLGRTRMHRTPLNTDIAVHNKLNSILKKANFIATRDNSIFVSSKKGDTFYYGSTYIIFPLDGFSYSWCATAVDLTTFYQLDSFRPLNNKFINDMYKLSPNDFVEKYKFKNNIDLKLALQKEYEILIHGTYIAINELDCRSYIFPNLFSNFKSENDIIESSCGGTSSGGISTGGFSISPSEGQFFGGNINSSIYNTIKKHRKQRKNKNINKREKI
jgi:hypothetical protein